MDIHHDDSTTSSILIVDDMPENLRVLAGILKDAGYQLYRLLKSYCVRLF